MLLPFALVLGAAYIPGGLGAAAFVRGGPGARRCSHSRAPQRRLRLCQEDAPQLDDKDWRAFRARLVAAQ